MRKFLPVLAGVIIAAGAVSGTALGHGKHQADATGVQAACVFNAVPVEGADAEPLYWGACSAEQVSLGGTTVTLVVVP